MVFASRRLGVFFALVVVDRRRRRRGRRVSCRFFGPRRFPRDRLTRDAPPHRHREAQRHARGHGVGLAEVLQATHGVAAGVS
jgi:hypothetical protein